MFINGTDQDDLLEGSEEADDIFGNEGADTILGNAGDDNISGGYGNDVLAGGAGDDFIFDSQGFTRVDGGRGNDTCGVGQSATVVGRSGDDTISGSDGRFLLKGQGGADLLRLNGASVAKAMGGSGDDLLIIGLEGSTRDVLMDGGSGHDAFLLADLTNDGVALDFTGLDSGEIFLDSYGLTLRNVESGWVVLDAGRNSIIVGSLDIDVSGGFSDDTVVAGRGSSRLEGGEGADVISAGGGSDTVSGGDGDDVLNGGSGDDTLQLESPDETQVDLANARSQFTGSGYDVVRNFENAIGGTGRDRILGSKSANTLEDDPKNSGGDNADTLAGRGGDDHLVAHVGGGTDNLIGGSGADVFLFIEPVSFFSDGNFDRIMDLTRKDWIDISAIDADKTTFEDDAFVLVDSTPQNPGEAALIFDEMNNVTMLQMKAYVGGGIDFLIILNGDERDFAHLIL